MRDFDYHFRKMTNGLEDHQFKHFNKSLGVYIYSKEHLKSEMKKQGQVPDSMASEMREDLHKRNPHKDYIASRKCHELVDFMMSKTKKGMICLGDYPKVVEAMEEMGMSFDMEKIGEMTD